MLLLVLRRIYGSAFRLGWLVAALGILIGEWQVLAGGVLASLAARLLGGPDPQFALLRWFPGRPQSAPRRVPAGPDDSPPTTGVREPRRPLPSDRGANAVIPRPSR